MERWNASQEVMMMVLQNVIGKSDELELTPRRISDLDGQRHYTQLPATDSE